MSGPSSDEGARNHAGGGDSYIGATPAVTVRPADRADLLDVLRIERNAFSEPWPYAAFESVLDAPAFLVAVGPGVDGDDTLLGYVVGDVMPNNGRDIGHIKDLAVRPDARGEGVGRRLLREALFGLALAGAVVVKLEVREGNDAARSLYREEGFEPTRRVPRYYGDGEDALILVVDVEAWRSAE
ncbi:ribosomal-protein-alanine N-acetyltransferase [Halobellus limi]|uniref:Ribosomal-protein-alanine N-acetyltransferase n=1 Tax=Halobellus limi TaxID=699433 RepID=A0A1H5VSC4_9EURY|nr:ribosomal-protein-alanine N-acetyltransferase [Halobellus limi]